MTYGDGAWDVRFSGGYVSGTPQLQSDLRLMIRQADSNLYDAKHGGKNLVIGGAYNRERAEKIEMQSNVTRREA